MEPVSLVTTPVFFLSSSKLQLLCAVSAFCSFSLGLRTGLLVLSLPIGHCDAQALWDKNSIYIVTPFYSGGEVFDVLTGKGRFEESEARPLFRQVLEALIHLKNYGVCHR